MPVILIVHYDAYITKFSVPLLSCLMYHNCVCFSMCSLGEQDSNLHGAFTGNVQLPLSLLGHSCPSPKKSGLIPDDFHYCPYHLLHYRRHACQLHHLPKALM
jgi:hypothetical protein